MKQDSILSKIIPHLLVLITGLIVLFAYFSPVLKNKDLYMSDIYQHRCMAKEIMDYREQKGEEALWTGTMFSGMPAYQIEARNFNPFRSVQVFFINLFSQPVTIFFFMFIGFYILALILKIDPVIGAAAALAYTFSAYYYSALEAGHTSKLMAWAFAAPMLGSMILIYRGRYLMGAALLATFTGFQMAANHPQITYYTAIMLGIYVLYETIRTFTMPKSGSGEEQAPARNKTAHALICGSVIAGAAALGLLTDTARIWTSYEYGKYSIRGNPSELSKNIQDEAKSGSKGVPLEYLVGWSYGIDETMTLLVPNYMGGASNFDFGDKSNLYSELKKQGLGQYAKQITAQAPGYWGDQPFTSGPFYAGAIVIFLFVLGLMIAIPPRYRWYALIVCAFFLLISWGGNAMWFTKLLYYNLPMYGMFRTPSMALMVVCLMLPLLGALALSRIMKTPPAERKQFLKPVYIAAGTVGGLCILLILAGYGILSFTSEPSNARMPEYLRDNPALVDAIVEDRASLLRMDALRSLALIIAAAGALWFLLTRPAKQKMNPAIIMACIGVLFLVDMVPVARRYLNNENFQAKMDWHNLMPMKTGDRFIRQNEKDIHYRVWHYSPNMFNDAYTSYFHKSIGGYHAVKLRRYQELFDEQVMSGKALNAEVISMLNTKWVLRDKEVKTPDGRTSQDNEAERWPTPLGNAWFVKNLKGSKNADEEMAAISSFKAAETAVISHNDTPELSGWSPSYDSTATIRLESYDPKHMVYKSSAKSEQYAVFSEIWYDKGWNAYINGQPAEYHRVNYVLRGMKVPGGANTIEFKFEPASYKQGNMANMVSFTVYALIAASAVILEMMRWRKSSLPQEK